MGLEKDGQPSHSADACGAPATLQNMGLEKMGNTSANMDLTV